MSNNMFSIIIPLFNKENFIHKTIMSILEQDYENYEIVVIDDKSEDGSYQKILEMKLQSDRINLYKNIQNSGVSFSRNKGIKYAKGDYIVFLDADDEISDPEFLRTLNYYIEKYNSDYIMTTRNYYGKKTKPELNCISDNVDKMEGGFYKIKDKKGISIDGKFPFGGSASAVVSRELLINKTFDIMESRFEDWLFFFDIFMRSNECYFYSVESIKINDDINSLSKPKRHRKKNINKYPEFYNYLSQKEDYKNLRKLFFWIWLTGEIKSIEMKYLRTVFKTNKSNIYKNISINKYSLYCFLIFILSILTTRRNANESY